MQKAPLIIPAMALSAGIWITGKWLLGKNIEIIAILVIVGCWLLIYTIYKKYDLNSLLNISILWIITGIIIGAHMFPVIHITDFENIKHISGTIITPIKQSSNQRYRFDIKVDSPATHQHKIRIYATANTSVSGLPLSVGDKVRIQGKYRPIAITDTNNFMIYLIQKGFIATCKADTITIIQKQTPFWEDVRQKMSSILNSTCNNPSGENLLRGLLLGDQQLISEDIRNFFNGTGAAHILSVSGFHVSLLIQLMLLVTTRLRIIIRQIKVAYVLMIIILLLFIPLTGYQPATIRAVIMGILVLLANILYRPTNYINLLALAVIIMLLIDPLFIYDIGFQLSCLAMIGLLVYQPFLFPSQYTDNLSAYQFLWHQCLQWCEAAVVAQLITLPTVIYYFHQFPTYFLIATIPIMILSIFCTYLGFCYLIIAYIPFIAGLAGTVLCYATDLLIRSAALFSSLPNAIISPLILSEIGCSCLNTLILLTAITIYESYPQKFIISSQA
jgi:competence protein ComEC